MSKVTVKLNEEGVIELFKSKEVQNWLDKLGAEAARNAGSGYSYRTHEADKTAICNVFPDTILAAKDNSENNTLLKVAGNIGTVGAKPRL